MDYRSLRGAGPAFNEIQNRSLRFVNYPLMFIVAGLAMLGLVAMYSSSAIYAETKGLSPFFFARKQGLWLLLGLFLAAVAAKADLERLRVWIKPFFALTAFLLLITLFMPKVAGASRWIPLGFMKLQTSELAKLAIVLYIADYFDRNASSVYGGWRPLLKPFIAVCVVLGLILLEPDLGTPSLLGAVTLLMFYAAGAPKKYVAVPMLAGIAGIVLMIVFVSYRLRRFLAFLSPWDESSGPAGYQLRQSLLAVGSGGWFGKGFGASKLKLSYLPEAHTDFIFPIFAEETGLVGTLIILGLFTALLVKGARIARNAPSMFTSLAALGFTLVIALQAFFNMAMSIGLTPTKGIAMPFFSYGGSSIMVTLIMAGIILNISAHRNRA